MKARPAPHPAAAVWPMLAEPDLRRLADDIATNGLRHPIVLDTEGRILDGRNRQAACRIADIEPTYETYEGDDPVAYILSANNERRHLSLPERAAATALTLAADGRRDNGRWEYGVVGGTAPENRESTKSRWSDAMAHAGLVLDHTPDLLPKVAAGTLALDAAVREAKEAKAREERRQNLSEDLGALVDAGELSLRDAERRARLSPNYAERVASGELSLDEAEHLNTRDEREYRESIQRAVDAIQGVLFGWPVVAHLKDAATRDDVLAELSEQEREELLKIEEALK